MRTVGRSRKGLAITLAVCALVAGGCSGGEERTEPPPRATTGADTVPTGPLRRLSLTIYLLDANRLVARPRSVATRERAEIAALRGLLRGPTSGEGARGLVSAIPPETALRGISFRGRVATVDLEQPPQDEDEPTQRPGIAQIVWTLTELPSVQAVAFGRTPQPAGIRRRDVAAYAPR